MQRTRFLNVRNFVTAFLSTSLGLAASVFAAEVPIIVNPDGKLTYIVASGANDSWAQGINDTGQVVGYPNIGDAYASPFITGPNGAGMSYLGTLGELQFLRGSQQCRTGDRSLYLNPIRNWKRSLPCLYLRPKRHGDERSWYARGG